MVQVGNRPFMLNFFALDPSSSDHLQTKKSNAGKIAGGVIGGLILLALICGISFYLWRKRRWANIYAQNRAKDARTQQWMVPPPNMYSRDMQKQSVLLGSSEDSIRDSTPAIPVNLGKWTAFATLFVGILTSFTTLKVTGNPTTGALLFLDPTEDRRLHGLRTIRRPLRCDFQKTLLSLHLMCRQAAPARMQMV